MLPCCQIKGGKAFIIISRDTKEAFYIIQHPFMINLVRLGVKGIT